MNLLTATVACAFLLIGVVGWVTFLPWLGHIVVKLLTFGRVELGWKPSDVESEVSGRVGAFVLLVATGLIAMVVHK
jgi:hypothetical protein